jgi:hypothetical protein
MEDSKSQEGINFSEIALEINTMAQEDQGIRIKEINNPDFNGGDIDRVNTERMKRIISQIGWPTISKVGKDASFNAWLLVQHADHDIEFQKQCLSLMEQEPNTEVSSHDVAYLTDRVRVHSGQPQIYGTQFKPDNPPFVPEEIENKENVEERRKQMGLGTLESSIDEMYRKYKIEKPTQ